VTYAAMIRHDRFTSILIISDGAGKEIAA
jgi:hypothetical protein